MTTRVADDFDAIRARQRELHEDRAPQVLTPYRDPPPDDDGLARYVIDDALYPGRPMIWLRGRTARRINATYAAGEDWRRLLEDVKRRAFERLHKDVSNDAAIAYAWLLRENDNPTLAQIIHRLYGR